jgi:hypothetical protein
MLVGWHCVARKGGAQLCPWQTPDDVGNAGWLTSCGLEKGWNRRSEETSQRKQANLDGAVKMVLRDNRSKWQNIDRNTVNSTENKRIKLFTHHCNRHWSSLTRHANNNWYFQLHPNKINNLLASPSPHFIPYYISLSCVKGQQRLPFTHFVRPPFFERWMPIILSCVYNTRNDRSVFFLFFLPLSQQYPPPPFTSTLNSLHRSFFDLSAPLLASIHVLELTHSYN